MTDFNEQSVLDGLRNLDSQCIGAIYDRYFPEVYRYVRYRISDETVAEDIASDVFVRLVDASQRRQGPQSNLRGWLIATASNAVNDHHRRHYRRPVEALSEAMPDHGPGVHAEVASREQQRIKQNAIRIDDFVRSPRSPLKGSGAGTAREPRDTVEAASSRDRRGRRPLPQLPAAVAAGRIPPWRDEIGLLTKSSK